MSILGEGEIGRGGDGGGGPLVVLPMREVLILGMASPCSPQARAVLGWKPRFEFIMGVSHSTVDNLRSSMVSICRNAQRQLLASN